MSMIEHPDAPRVKLIDQPGQRTKYVLGIILGTLQLPTYFIAESVVYQTWGDLRLIDTILVLGSILFVLAIVSLLIRLMRAFGLGLLLSGLGSFVFSL